MPREIAKVHAEMIRKAEDLRCFEHDWVYVLDPFKLATQSLFAPYWYMMGFSIGEEQRQSEKRRHEHSPRVQNGNVWREVKPELDAILAKIENTHEKYNYLEANLISSENSEFLIAKLEEESERKRLLLENVEHLIHVYLSDATLAMQALFVPAVEATQTLIQELQNQHLKLLKSREAAAECLREQQIKHVTTKVFSHLELQKHSVSHVSKGQALPNTPGVYIITRDKIMYVGQTKNVRARFSSHDRNGYFKEHDLVSIVEAPDDEYRISIESNLINVLKPPLNKKK